MAETPNTLRLRNRQRRSQLDETQRQQAASRLFDALCQLDEYHQASHIAAYWSVNGEIDLSPLIDHALQHNKHIYLPVLDTVSLRFAPYDKDTPLRINRFKLPEPDVSDAVMRQPSALDLVLVPLTVFDPACNRIGMGGGYYDRSFEFRRTSDATRPILVGVAHALQRVDQLQPEPWDVQLDAVVTDEHIYRA